MIGVCRPMCEIGSRRSTMYSIETRARFRPRLLLPSTSSSLGRSTIRCRTVNRYRKKTLMLSTRLSDRIGIRRPTTVHLSEPLGSPGSHTNPGREQHTDISSLSKSLGRPAPQTSLSTSSRISSLNRMLTYSISQFSNFQTSLSFPSSLTSPQTQWPPVIADGSAIRIARAKGVAGIHGGRFYDG